MKAPLESSREDRLEMHREKMRNKAHRRGKWHSAANMRRYSPAPVSRHTGKPHEHARECARRVRHEFNAGCPR